MSVFRQSLITATVLFLSACSSNPEYLQVSDTGIKAPEEGLPFEDYVSDSKAKIQQVLESKQSPSHFQSPPGGYTFAQAAEFRAPFQIPTDSGELCEGKGAGKGFLLIHGLTDSPYLMRSMGNSVHRAYPCALVRAILLPGHGTIPGDSIDRTNMTYENWLQATSYGITSLDDVKGIEDVYVVTFSTGAPLLINYLYGETPHAADKVRGAVFLSAAIKASTSYARLARLASYVMTWGEKTNEQDAVRYESFSLHAGAEFYSLTKYLDDDQYRFTLPLFVAISADDTTVDPEAALTYFCEAESETKHLIWYESPESKARSDKLIAGTGDCQRHIERRSPADVPDIPSYYKSFAHTALSVSPDDKHYGAKGSPTSSVYSQCKHDFDFDEPDKQAFRECVNAEPPDFLMGEGTAALKELAQSAGLKWRRGTFNPDYAHMEAKIFQFLNMIEGQ